MPRSIKKPITGVILWYYPNPAPAAPLAALVTQTVSWSDATETGVFNLFVLSQAAVASAVLNVAYTGAGGVFQTVTAAAIAAGGANYNVGDQVTLSNGVVLSVAAVTTGAITTANVVNGGSSTTASPPANPVAQVSTTGTGTGATFNLTWSSGAWCTYPRIFESTSTQQPAGLMAKEGAPGSSDNVVAPGADFSPSQLRDMGYPGFAPVTAASTPVPTSVAGNPGHGGEEVEEEDVAASIAEGAARRRGPSTPHGRPHR